MDREGGRGRGLELQETREGLRGGVEKFVMAFWDQMGQANEWSEGISYK